MYLCSIKRVASIWLAGLFLISGIGINMQFDYCCGMLEEIHLFDALELGLHECCGDQKGADCAETAHWFSTPEHIDLQTASLLKVQDAFVTLLPQIPLISQVSAIRPAMCDQPMLLWDPGPPLQVLHQSFLI